MERMPEPTTVWMVRLRRGDAGEEKGTLRLEDDCLVFEDAAVRGLQRLAFAHVRRARRVRGSPILMVTHGQDDTSEEIAFYFTEPPPLKPAQPGQVSPATTRTGGRPVGAFSAMRRSSKRRHVRDNVRYLTTQSGSKKLEIEAWVDAIASRTRGG